MTDYHQVWCLISGHAVLMNQTERPDVLPLILLLCTTWGHSNSTSVAWGCHKNALNRWKKKHEKRNVFFLYNIQTEVHLKYEDWGIKTDASIKPGAVATWRQQSWLSTKLYFSPISAHSLNMSSKAPSLTKT